MKTVKVWGIYCNPGYQPATIETGWQHDCDRTYWTLDRDCAAIYLKYIREQPRLAHGEILPMPDELVATIPDAAAAASALAEMRRADLALLREIREFKESHQYWGKVIIKQDAADVYVPWQHVKAKDE